MVQESIKPSDKPFGVEPRHNASGVAKSRARSTSQPIPPLRPVIPKPADPPNPVVPPPSSFAPPTFTPESIDTFPAAIDPPIDPSVAPSPVAEPTPKHAKRRVRVTQVVKPLVVASVRQIPPLVDRSQATVRQVGRRLAWLKPNETMRRWIIVWFAGLGAFAGITTLAFTWLATVPPSADCKQVTTTSPGNERLYCAQEKARSGELKDLSAAIALLEDWSPTEPLFKDTQEQMDEWAGLMLVIARTRLVNSDFVGAIEAAEQVPASTAVYLDAQKQIATWRTEWQEGEALFAKAREAIKAQNWKLASQQVVELGYLNHDYWRIQQADVLFKQIVREKQARINVDQAKKLAKTPTPDNLKEAILLVQKVPSHTDASTEAQAALKEWSQTLITYALEQWQTGDRTGAFDTALKLPLDPSLPQLGRDLIQLSKANQLVRSNQSIENPTANPKALWNLFEAVSAVRQIAPDSPFYADAQAAMADWQTKLEDLSRLSFAGFMADFGDRDTLEFAIAQAKQVSEESAYADQSQSLVQRWQQLIRGLEDRPYLARARSWAASGKIPDLRAAIAQVSQIPKERAVWQQAQQLIAQWTDQIETVEDQPIWDQAQKLAGQKKWEAAIAELSKIQSDRALYQKAQVAIDGWEAKIQQAEIAADQPILDRANGLAWQGRLSMAIDTAAQIAPGRALYNEAQASIKAWSELREEVWKSQDSSGGSSGESSADTASPASATPDSDRAASGSSSADDTSEANSESNSDSFNPDLSNANSETDSSSSANPSADNNASVDEETTANPSVEGYYDERFYDSSY